MIEGTDGRVDVAPARFDEIRALWRGRGGTTTSLAELVKDDLRRRFAEGQRPAVADYLRALPDLGDDSERMLSLIYEEFCLREEAGEAPDPDSFCERYAPWRDSLASQLNYHRMLSQAVGALPGPVRFPEPGEHFLRFRLRSLLGRGGAACVFLADDEDLGGRPSALKVSPDRGEEPSIMGRLQHPHIMPVHSVVRDPETGLRGLCMPYRPGRPLDQVLRRMENIPPAKRSARTLLEAAAPEDLAVRVEWKGFPRRGSYADACCWLGANLAEALAHAHDLGILHRDVKPANVLLSAAEGPQLLDFNLAHDPNAPDRAESALRGGTLPYMAPEQLEAFRDPDRWDDVGPSADLYALGLVLRELLTGRRPEAPPADLPLPRAINELLALRVDGWPPIRPVNPMVPHALEAVVRRSIAGDPADRYPVARAMADDLRAVLARRPLRLAVNPSRPERVRFWLRRHRLALGVSAALVFGSAGVFAANRAFQDAGTYVFRGQKAHLQFVREGAEGPEATAILEEAERAFRRAIELEPGRVDAHSGMGLVERDRKNLGRATSWFDRAILLGKADPTTPPEELADIHVFRAETLIILANDAHVEDAPRLYAMAEDDLDHAIRLIPADTGHAPEGASDAEEDLKLKQKTTLARIHLWAGRAKVGQCKLNPSSADQDRLLREAGAHFAMARDEYGLERIDSKMATDFMNLINEMIGTYFGKSPATGGETPSVATRSPR